MIIVNWLDSPDTENNQLMMQLEYMMKDVLKKLEGGYLTTFYYDCAYIV